MRDIIIVGAGGHAKSLIDIIECQSEYEIKGIIDIQLNDGESFCGYKILGDDSVLNKFIANDMNFAIGVGQIKSPSVRKNLFNKLSELGANIPCIISPHAYISRRSKMGIGNTIFHNALINSYANIGNNVIINSKVLVEHDCTVGDNSHIAVGAILSGGVTIGEGSFIGAGSVIIQGVTIGNDVIIGAGVIVKHDILSGTLK